MHYANGREAQKGDSVVGADPNGRPIGGVVMGLMPGSDTCNIEVIPLAGGYIATCTAGECLHVADVEAAGLAHAEKMSKEGQSKE